MSEDKVRALSGTELKTLAAGGGFAIDETTGDKLIQALASMLDSLHARWPALQQFAQTPPMSTTAAAQWVSRTMLDTATDEHGLLTQLRHARDEFPAYIEAIKLAKRNYAAQEADTGGALAKVDPGKA